MRCYNGRRYRLKDCWLLVVGVDDAWCANQTEEFDESETDEQEVEIDSESDSESDDATVQPVHLRGGGAAVGHESVGSSRRTLLRRTWH